MLEILRITFMYAERALGENLFGSPITAYVSRIMSPSGKDKKKPF